MKKIELLDNAANAGKNLKEQGINYYFYHAYKNSQEAKLETLNFYDEIKSDEIADVVAACQNSGLLNLRYPAVAHVTSRD